MRRQNAFFAHGVDVHVHKAVNIGRVAGGQVDAQGIANKIDYLGIFGNIGIFAENGAGFGLFHVAFNADDAFAVHLGKQGVEQGQGFQIAPLAGAGVGKKVLEAFDDEPEGVLGLRTEKRAQAAAQNDDEFSRLEQHRPLAVGERVAGKHRKRDYDQTDN